MCYYHQNACLLVCLSPVCLSVSQTSRDDSGHKGNTGQMGGCPKSEAPK